MFDPGWGKLQAHPNIHKPHTAACGFFAFHVSRLAVMTPMLGFAILCFL